MPSQHVAFDVHFEHQSCISKTTSSYSLHHFVEPGLPDQSLVKWGILNKLHPWVGLAAPILVFPLGYDVAS